MGGRRGSEGLFMCFARSAIDAPAGRRQKRTPCSVGRDQSDRPFGALASAFPTNAPVAGGSHNPERRCSDRSDPIVAVPHWLPPFSGHYLREHYPKIY